MPTFLSKTCTASLLCLTAATFADNIPSTVENCPSGKRHFRAAVKHIEGGGIGYNQGYTTLESFFAPDPMQWSVMPFLDLRGHVFDNGKLAANFGAGLRKIMGSRTYGLNAYYDYRNTSKLHYNQIGVGLETLGKLWDFRINGYLPVGKKITSPYQVRFYEFFGHHMIFNQKYQYAMKGADAEVGFHFGKVKNFDFYAATGPYYYIGEVGGNAWGGKGRINGTWKDCITLEISDSLDSKFHNNLQGQLTFTFPFGPKSTVKKKGRLNTCTMANSIVSRMVQPVGRQEIIVVGKSRNKMIATDPATGLPYYFVFVNNTSSSDGTYESPYPTLLQAQNNSSPNDIIYVFPGDGTTKGMDSGITLKENQKFWGSGVSHMIRTLQGNISIPAQTSASPTITNTNPSTDGNAVNLSTNNAISGFTITSAMQDAIHGDNSQTLDVSYCRFENTTNFAIYAAFPSDASVSMTSSQFLNNNNGIILNLAGTSDIVCSRNTFEGQTSVSEAPIEIVASNNSFSARIDSNLFHQNTTGSISISLTDVVDADIVVLNNAITNNDSGAIASLGSSLVFYSIGNIDHCSISLMNNFFSENTQSSLFMYSSGQMKTLDVTALSNTMDNIGGGALVLATPADHLTLLAAENTISGCNDSGISVASMTPSTTGNITINNNIITDIANQANGIAINQPFTALDLTLLNNEIYRCEGTGIIGYPNLIFDSLTVNISGNRITDCQNLGSSTASGLDIEQYTNLAGSITNNTLLNNTGLGLAIGTTSANGTVCLTLSDNVSSSDYQLTNTGVVPFNLSPCDVDDANEGIINTVGLINKVQSCPGAIACPP